MFGFYYKWLWSKIIKEKEMTLGELLEQIKLLKEYEEEYKNIEMEIEECKNKIDEVILSPYKKRNYNYDLEELEEKLCRTQRWIDEIKDLPLMTFK